MTTRSPEPEQHPPSPNFPQPPKKVLSSVEYLRELSKRLEVIAKEHVQGVKATREVGIAAMLIAKFADDWEEQEGG